MTLTLWDEHRKRSCNKISHVPSLSHGVGLRRIAKCVNVLRYNCQPRQVWCSRDIFGKQNRFAPPMRLIATVVPCVKWVIRYVGLRQRVRLSNEPSLDEINTQRNLLSSHPEITRADSAAYALPWQRSIAHLIRPLKLLYNNAKRPTCLEATKCELLVTTHS